MIKAPLSSIAEIIRGVSFSKEEGNTVRSEGKLPVIRAGSIQDSLLLHEGQIWVPKEKISEKQKIRRNDIIICTSSGSSDLVGKCARSEVDFKGSFGAFCAGIRPNEDKISASFLYHFLSSPSFRNWAKGSSGANIKNIRISELAEFEIPLPPLPEQKRIAAILDKADAIRRKRQQAIQLADDFLRAVFLDMFGDPVTNPKGWELLPFSRVGTLDRGKSRHRPRNDPALLGGTHPLIQTGEVANSRGYIKNYSATYSDLGLAQSKKWEAGTLCITIAANIAKTGILTFPACFPDSVVGFIPNKNVTVEFIQHWLGFLQKNLEENAPQAAQKNINLQILRELLIPVPPRAEQEKFSKIVASIHATEKKITISGNTLGNAFDALCQKAFSGQL